MAVRFETTSTPFFWYRQAQLILCDNRLYTSFKVLGSGNARILQTILAMDPVPVAVLRVNCGDLLFHPKYLLTIVYLDSLHYSVYYSQEDFRPNCARPGALFLDCLTPAVKLIQRNMRNLARARIQRRQQRLVLVMATHARLGQHSMLARLDPDLLRVVCSGL